VSVEGFEGWIERLKEEGRKRGRWNGGDEKVERWRGKFKLIAGDFWAIME
jgi:hypothetical protein